jgi:hypothetical protein
VKPEGKILAQIIDGQHRIRGCAASPTRHDELLITTIIPRDHFGDHDIGSMFIEMNSESQPIKPIHKMHLQARYGLPPFVDENKKGYDLMMKLYDTTGNPLHKENKRIKILDGKHPPYNSSNLAKQLGNLYRKDPAVFKGAKKMDYDLIEDYIRAVEKTWKTNWDNSDSQLSSTDGFNEIIIPLMSAYLERARSAIPASSPSKWPSRAQWEEAVNCNFKTSSGIVPANEFVNWSSDIFSLYVTQRQHPIIVKIMERLITSSPLITGAPNEIDATSLKEDTLQDYLREKEPEAFDIVVRDSAGSSIPTASPLTIPAAPKKGNMFIFWERDEIAKEKADLKITDQPTKETLREGIFKSSNQADLFFNHIPKGSFSKGFKAGKYTIEVTQYSPANKSRSATLDLEFV